MGGRKDMHNKRQLSIIDETDYFSDDGYFHGQTHDKHCLNIERVSDNISSILLHNPLDITHISIATKSSPCSADKADTCLSEDNGSCIQNHCQCSITRRSRHCFGELPPSMTSSLVNQSTVGLKLVNAETYCFKTDTISPKQNLRPFDLKVLNGYDETNKATLCIQSRNIGDEFGSSLPCKYAKSDITNSESGMRNQYITYASPAPVQEASMDSIHEMFQVLIKCIEGTLPDKQTRYGCFEPDDTGQTSPLLYLMEEKVEKQPPALNNIISSFKEKFSLPNSNAKRLPVRQKSKRTLVLEKITEKALAETDIISSRPLEQNQRETRAYENYEVHSETEMGCHNKVPVGDEFGAIDIVFSCAVESPDEVEKRFLSDEVDFETMESDALVRTKTDITTAVRIPNSISESNEHLESTSTLSWETPSILIRASDDKDNDDDTLNSPLDKGKSDPITTCNENHVITDDNFSPNQNNSAIIPSVSKLPIPTFKRDGPKVYEEFDGYQRTFLNFQTQSSATKMHEVSGKADGINNFLTVPNLLQTPSQTSLTFQTAHQQTQNKKSLNSSRAVSTLAVPTSQDQHSKPITFLNPNGSIARRPMLRHVSQPNMNALITATQFPNSPGTTSAIQQSDTCDSSLCERNKYQTKDLNSDLAKLKATAVRLKLVTRRPSYLEWLEERRKNRPPLGVLEMATAGNQEKRIPNPACPPNSPVNREATKLERIIGQCQSAGLMNSLSQPRNATCSRLDNDNKDDCCGSNGSSRRNSCSSDGSSSFDSHFSSNTEEKSSGDDDVFIQNAEATDASPAQSYSQPLEQKRDPDVRGWLDQMSRDRLTAARKERIDKSLEWLRNELKSMRSQDQALARQLLSLRHEMHKLRLSWSCQEHRDLLDEVQSDLEDFHEFSKVLDLPSTVYLDTPLKNVGVTKLNISARRFSTC